MMVSGDLDLSATAAPAATSSLELSDASARQPMMTSAPRRLRTTARAQPGTQTILTPKAPTVTLTRVQSGVGSLTFEAACPEVVGDLRLGCAYQMRSGYSSTVQLAGGSRVGPKDSARPVIMARHEQYERLSIDLRHSRDIERLVVYGFSESGAVLQWGGTLVATTLGQAKIEVPIDQKPSAGVLVLISLYNIRGEFVLRAEMETVHGTIRDACKAYGYERITWLDERTPIV
jgi:uncharacterized protein involved in tellurium resistance